VPRKRPVDGSTVAGASPGECADSSLASQVLGASIDAFDTTSALGSDGKCGHTHGTCPHSHRNSPISFGMRARIESPPGQLSHVRSDLHQSRFAAERQRSKTPSVAVQVRWLLWTYADTDPIGYGIRYSLRFCSAGGCVGTETPCVLVVRMETLSTRADCSPLFSSAGLTRSHGCGEFTTQTLRIVHRSWHPAADSSSGRLFLK
jgi:hypothetical protein